jgi:hypothetical protein
MFQEELYSSIPNVTKTFTLKGVQTSIVQHLTDADKVARKEICMQIFHRIQVDKRFLDCLIFSDESTFHVSGKFSSYNCRIWGSENPHVPLDHVDDSSKVNVFCALNKERVYGHLVPRILHPWLLGGGIS